MYNLLKVHVVHYLRTCIQCLKRQTETAKPMPLSPLMNISLTLALIFYQVNQFFIKDVEVDYIVNSLKTIGSVVIIIASNI